MTVKESKKQQNQRKHVSKQSDCWRVQNAKVAGAWKAAYLSEAENQVRKKKAWERQWRPPLSVCGKERGGRERKGVWVSQAGESVEEG